jgi:hypothetical protein
MPAITSSRWWIDVRGLMCGAKCGADADALASWSEGTMELADAKQ